MEIHRYIVMVDTMSSDVYDPVLEFLSRDIPNVSTYYSGGNADFVCDVNMTDQNFASWKDDLCKVLRDCGGKSFVEPGHDVKDLLTIFRAAENALIRCGTAVNEYGPPTRKGIDRIKQNPVQFEFALRNYRSLDTLESFGGDIAAVESYLDFLKAEKVIVCFRVIADTSRSLAQDFVAFGIHDKGKEDFAASLVENNFNLLEPVKEFFRVERQKDMTSTTPEIAITHIMFNSYSFPGERSDWKKSVYRWAKTEARTDVNIFNYPLEGTINESATFLSDYPSFLKTVKRYGDASGGKGVFVGYGLHPAAGTKSIGIEFALSGLGQHGVLLGVPGSGKTNSGLVLALGLLKHVKNVFILDASDAIGQNYSESIKLHKTAFTQLTIESSKQLERKLSEHVNTRGLIVIDCKEFGLPRTLDGMMKFALGPGGVAQGIDGRRIEHAMLVEEAHSAWEAQGKTSIERAKEFNGFLNQAYRKGWSVWLSTQRPQLIGPDSATSEILLKSLRNKVIHGALAEDKSLLSANLERAGGAKSDVEYFDANIGKAGRGKAILLGMSGFNANDILPPLLVSVPMLSEVSDAGELNGK